MWSNKNNVTVLSICPTARGYAFALFDGPLSPYDWGVKDVRRRVKTAETLDAVDALIERYHPDIMIMADIDQPSFRRPPQTRALYIALRNLAELRGVSVEAIKKDDIRLAFSRFGAKTKHQIARVIAREVTVFAHLAPKPRRAWMSESRRQGLFDAAALGLTYYSLTDN